MPRGGKGSDKPGTFKPGNKSATGNKGASRPSFLTQALISQLHEIDKDTGKEVLHDIAAKLILCARGGLLEYKKKGKVYHIVVPPEGWAMRELFDRVQGKAVQSFEVDPENNTIVLRYDREDGNAV